MRVEIDKSRRDDEAGRVDRCAARKWLRGNCSDAPAADADVANRIEARFRIDDPAADDHEIEILRVQKCRQPECHSECQRT